MNEDIMEEPYSAEQRPKSAQGSRQTDMNQEDNLVQSGDYSKNDSLQNHSKNLSAKNFIIKNNKFYQPQQRQNYVGQNAQQNSIVNTTLNRPSTVNRSGTYGHLSQNNKKLGRGEADFFKQNMFYIDKEKLFEDLQNEKSKNNEYKEENLKLLTRCSNIEKEICKYEKIFEDMHTSGKNALQKINPDLGPWKQSHYIVSLRKQVKELGQEVKFKSSELEKTKKNIKYTKFTEIELEKKAFADETIRLKRIIEQLMAENKKQQSNDYQLKQHVDRIYLQDSLIDQLRKDNTDMANAIRAIEEKNYQLEMQSQKQLNEIKHLKNTLADKKGRIDRIIGDSQSGSRGYSPGKNCIQQSSYNFNTFQGNQPPKDSNVEKLQQQNEYLGKEVAHKDGKIKELELKLKQADQNMLQEMQKKHNEIKNLENSISGQKQQQNQPSRQQQQQPQQQNQQQKQKISPPKKQQFQDDQQKSPQVRKIELEEVKSIGEEIKYSLIYQKLNFEELEYSLFDNIDNNDKINFNQLAKALQSPPLFVTDQRKSKILAQYLIQDDLLANFNATTKVSSDKIKERLLIQIVTEYLLDEDNGQYDDEIKKLLKQHHQQLRKELEAVSKDKQNVNIRQLHQAKNKLDWQFSDDFAEQNFYLKVYISSKKDFSKININDMFAAFDKKQKHSKHPEENQKAPPKVKKFESQRSELEQHQEKSKKVKKSEEKDVMEEIEYNEEFEGDEEDNQQKLKKQKEEKQNQEVVKQQKDKQKQKEQEQLKRQKSDELKKKKQDEEKKKKIEEEKIQKKKQDQEKIQQEKEEQEAAVLIQQKYKKKEETKRLKEEGKKIQEEQKAKVQKIKEEKEESNAATIIQQRYKKKAEKKRLKEEGRKIQQAKKEQLKQQQAQNDQEENDAATKIQIKYKKKQEKKRLKEEGKKIQEEKKNQNQKIKEDKEEEDAAIKIQQKYKKKEENKKLKEEGKKIQEEQKLKRKQEKEEQEAALKIQQSYKKKGEIKRLKEEGKKLQEARKQYNAEQAKLKEDALEGVKDEFPEEDVQKQQSQTKIEETQKEQVEEEYPEEFEESLQQKETPKQNGKGQVKQPVKTEKTEIDEEYPEEFDESQQKQDNAKEQIKQGTEQDQEIEIGEDMEIGEKIGKDDVSNASMIV